MDKRKEIYPNDDLKIIFLVLYIVGVIFFSLLTYIFYLSGNIITISITGIATLFIVVFIPPYSISLWRKTRPYVISERWIEIPAIYTPNENKTKVEYEEIQILRYKETKKYGKILAIKTKDGDYLIRNDIEDKVLDLFPTSVLKKLEDDIDG